MDNFGKWTWLAVRAPIVLVVLWFNFNLWTLNTTDPEPPVDALNALGADLRNGAGDDMQALFPEGYSITHALVGFAWVDVALGAEAGTAEHEHALAEARWMEKQVASPEGYRIFPENGSPKYGAFYRGYLAWLRGGILLADPSDPPEEVATFQRDTDEIAAAFRAAQTPYLESYHRMAWPADNVFLVAALALHDKQFEPRYQADIERWVRMARERMDPRLGMIPHSADPETGAVQMEPRGCSNGVVTRMLYEIDTEFAADQYRKTREHFVVSHLGLFPGFYEYAKDRSGPGDVDSGPLIFGISASASVLGVAAAKFQGDREFADPTLAGVHAVGMPLFDRYGAGILPVGEAFLAWTTYARPWVGPPPKDADWERIMLPGWRFVWHLLSALLLAGLFSGELVGALKQRRLKPR